MTVHCIRALDVVVGVPTASLQDFEEFPRDEGPPSVELPECDRVTMSGTFTREVVDRTELLCVHAGVVSTPAGAVLMPGPSGLGKSTLVAALVKAGFGYLSDEVAAISRTDLRVRSFPRPITLDENSLDLVGLPRDLCEPGEAEAVVAPRLLGRTGPSECKVAAIVLPRRTPGPVSLEPGSRVNAAAAMIEQCFNHFRWPASSLAVIAQLVRSTPIWDAAYSHPAGLARQFAERVASTTRN